MKSKSPYKIDLEIYIVFVVVISVSVFNAIYSTIQIASSQKSVNKILTVETPALQKLQELNLLFTQSAMLTTNWVYLPDNSENNKDNLRLILNVEYPILKNSIINLFEKTKSNEESNLMFKCFDDFDEIVEQQKLVMSLLVDFEDYQNPEKHFQAEEILQYKVTPLTNGLVSRINAAILKKKTGIDELHSKIDESSRVLLFNVQAIAILIVFVILLATFYMSTKIIVPIMRLKNHILRMAKGEIPEVDLRYGKNAIGQMIEALKLFSISLRETTYFANKIGYGNLTAEFQPLSEKDELRNSLLQMRDRLRFADEENKKRSWALSLTEKINEALKENTDNITTLSNALISTIAKVFGAYQAGFYLSENSNGELGGPIVLQGVYAMDQRKIGQPLKSDEQGLISQVFHDGEFIYLRNVKNTKIKIKSGLSEFTPTHILIVPIRFECLTIGVIEISGFNDFSNYEIDYIKNVGDKIATSIMSVRANMLTKRLLQESRELSDRLSVQDEDMKKTNEALSIQSKLLQDSEEELKHSNNDLKQKARELQLKNEINEQARIALIQKTKELEESNKYKAEFLANMSHELRTPLNSVLILARLLEENKEKTLTDKQREYAAVIQKSGKSLLTIINDILDHSKIEAGKIEIYPENIDLKEVCEDMRLLFDEFAIEKMISFKVIPDENLSKKFISDKSKLEQVIKNLLSNAFKFTSGNGLVTLRVNPAKPETTFLRSDLKSHNQVIEFEISDTGIGIEYDKQTLIFEAFQQADGSISKSFGGTGLGLSISKMLVAMLGGEIQLKSEPGKGSTFYFYLPVLTKAEGYLTDQKEQLICSRPKIYETDKLITTPLNIDDRENINEGDKTILIVEGDSSFANILLELAHQRNFKGIVANDGKEGLLFAARYRPSAIIMDMQLPEINGWSVLDELKSNNELKNIPVHVMSAIDRQRIGMDMGAATYLKKPLDLKDLNNAFITIDRSVMGDSKHVLLVEDVVIHQEIVKNLLITQYSSIEVHVAGNLETAKDLMVRYPIDFIVLDLDLGNGAEEGISFLENVKGDNNYCNIPVVVFTGLDVDGSIEQRINALSTKIVNKDGTTFDTLLAESDSFLKSINRPEEEFTSTPDYMLNILKEKSVLLIDEDMRNVYVLTGLLETQKMHVKAVLSGSEALKNLEDISAGDIVLIDMGMSSTDGFELIRRLRSNTKHQNVPIIAVTTKAMVGEREKCLQCGASDYISKPINPGQLLSLMRVWLYKE